MKFHYLEKAGEKKLQRAYQFWLAAKFRSWARFRLVLSCERAAMMENLLSLRILIHRVLQQF
jgi:hypothetical protein